MIYVPIWLFILTLAAKGLNIVRGAWQVRCTRKKGRFTIPLSCMYMGTLTTIIGFMYYAWMVEPIGMLGHIWTFGILINNIYYKRKQCKN